MGPAAINGPRSVVISGAEQAVAQVAAQWESNGRKVKQLRVRLNQTVFDLHGKLARYKAKFDALISAHYTAAVILHDKTLTLAQFEPARYEFP